MNRKSRIEFLERLDAEGRRLLAMFGVGAALKDAAVRTGVESL